MKIILKGKEATDYLEYLNKKEDVALLHENDIQTHEQSDHKERKLSPISISQDKEEVQGINIPDVCDTQKDDINQALAEIDLSISDSASPSEKKIACRKRLEYYYPLIGKEDFQKGLTTINKIFPFSADGAKWNNKIIDDVFSFILNCKSNAQEFDWDRLSKVARKATRKVYFDTSWYISGISEKLNNGGSLGDFTCEQYNRLKGPKIEFSNYEEVSA